jgi:hypothetical protein
MQPSIKYGLVVALVAAVSVVNAASLNPDALRRAAPIPSVKEKGSEPQPDFGTNFFYTAVEGSQLHPTDDTATFVLGSSSGAYYCKTGTPVNQAIGQFPLPHGVRLNQFRVWMYDGQATSAVAAELERACLPDFAAADPTVDVLATITSTDAFAGGFFHDFVILPGTTLIDNQSCTYRVRATVGTTGCPGVVDLGIYKARLSWQRFIPVAPAVATFVDVPTGSQFFAEVEALADTGITAGCTATQFCPGNAVTRLQMAAFLARALGLPPSTIADPANP